MIDIPLHLLSRTFQDAIQVTRALGLRFLWIDSLCIVQDDKNDWTIEAAKMAQVYQGSYFTIAATSSTNSDGGLKTIWDSRLSSRAWVLQEQVLSPRLIHFTEHQMFFQCFSGLESEDGTVNDAGLSSLKGTALTPEGEMGLGMRDFSTPAQAISSWWSWVEEYSYRSLTFHSDRMAAVAGIVMYYRSVTLDEAILGLWKETLWSDLGWQVDDSSNQDVTSHLPAK
ncbi:heterokaryon incompatibility protein-domain-containing protein [Bisporella sp. PMI_857]|nr:heterokaryon incompatibility protein-domain-containing protein [Bisporella sp. PMI_857]